MNRSHEFHLAQGEKIANALFHFSLRDIYLTNRICYLMLNKYKNVVQWKILVPTTNTQIEKYHNEIMKFPVFMNQFVTKYTNNC